MALASSLVGFFVPNQLTQSTPQMPSTPSRDIPPLPLNHSKDCPHTCPPHQPAVSGDVDSMQEKRSLDFTQRIERKLAEYNSARSVCRRWIVEIICLVVSAISMIAMTLILFRLKNKLPYRVESLLTLANVLGKISSAALIVPTSEALGQLKWNWFSKSNAMWDFDIFDKATR